MIRIHGLDKLSKDLEQAQKAMAELDGELGTVTFKPDDPASIEEAITAAAALIDERLGPYASNPIVGPMAERLKEQYRDSIIERAAAARLEGGQADDE